MDGGGDGGAEAAAEFLRWEDGYSPDGPARERINDAQGFQCAHDHTDVGLMEGWRKGTRKRFAADQLSGDRASDGVNENEVGGERQQVGHRVEITLEPAQEDAGVSPPGRLKKPDYLETGAVITRQLVADPDDRDHVLILAS